jgi:hypothetical protein
VRNNNHSSEDPGIADVDQVPDPEHQQAAPRPPRARTKPKQGGEGAAPVANEEDRQLDYSLRPRSLAEFIGQQRIKQVLGMSIEAARKRGEAPAKTMSGSCTSILSMPDEQIRQLYLQGVLVRDPTIGPNSVGVKEKTEGS